MAGKCYFLIVIVVLIRQQMSEQPLLSGRWGQFTRAIKRVSDPPADMIGAPLFRNSFIQMCRWLSVLHAAAFIRANPG